MRRLFRRGSGVGARTAGDVEHHHVNYAPADDDHATVTSGRSEMEMATTNPYDETSAGGKRTTVFNYNNGGDTDGLLHGATATGGRPPRSRFAVFAVVLLVLFLVGCLAALVLGAMAQRANSSTDFKCSFTHAGPQGVIGAALAAIFAFGFMYAGTRGCWYYNAPDGSVTCGRVIGRTFLTLGMLVLILCTVGASIIAWLIWAMAQQHPDLDKSISIDANDFDGYPRAPVTISRDRDGLAHVLAMSKEDVVFGQGFAQAQDRLWQLEFQRIVAQGRLAEHVGQAGLKIDKDIRTLGVQRAADAMCATASASYKAYMTAFVAGINAFLSKSKKRPVEFFFMSSSTALGVTRHEPQPFTTNDVCYAAKLLQLKLAGNMKQEAQRFRMWWAQRGSAAEFDATYDDITNLYFNQSNVSHTILTSRDLGITAADVESQRARERASRDAEAALYADGGKLDALRRAAFTSDPVNGHARSSTKDGDENGEEGIGLLDLLEDHASNAWAARAAGADVEACGASDPHLEINLPSVWYYNHLAVAMDAAQPDDTSFEVSGVSMTGIPGVHIGKGQSVSWGVTMAITDIQDLYVAIPDPAAPNERYLLANGTSVPYTLRTESIKVKRGFPLGDKTETLTVRETMYGPDVSETVQLPSTVRAFLWTPVLREDATSIEALAGFMELSTSTTARDLCQLTFQKLRSPAFSVPVEDAFGNLAYCISGAYRQRPIGHTGMWPTVGDGTLDPPPTEIPTSELPQKVVTRAQIETSGGASISAANQKIYPDGYRYVLGYEYVPPNRGGRLQQVLQNPAHRAWLSDVNFHMGLQLDIQSNVWAYALRAGVSDRLRAGTAGRQGCLTPDGGSLVDNLLLVWDGRAERGKRLPTVLWRWIRDMSHAAAPVTGVLGDGLDYWPAQMFVPTILTGNSNRSANATAFFERLCTAAVAKEPAQYQQSATCSLPPCWHLAATLLNKRAADDGTDGARAPALGTDVAHLAANNLMMAKSPLSCMFDRILYKSGDQSTVNVNAFDVSNGPEFTSTHASSMRQVYDWNAPSHVHFAWPGGASGYPYSDRYFNLAERFENGEYVSVKVSGGLPSAANTSHRMNVSP